MINESVHKISESRPSRSFKIGMTSRVAFYDQLNLLYKKAFVKIYDLENDAASPER
jgi:hypothetical protein